MPATVDQQPNFRVYSGGALEFFKVQTGQAVGSTPNLSCVIRLRDVTEASPGTVLFEGQAPYNSSGIAVFKINDLLKVGAAPPPDSAMGMTGFTGGKADGGWGRFVFDFADKYGDPVSQEGFQESDVFSGIHGAWPVDHHTPAFQGAELQTLHAFTSYDKFRGQSLTFPCQPAQPMFIYWTTTDSGLSYTLMANVYYKDGTSDEDIVIGDLSTIMDTTGAVYWTVVGFNQLNLGSISPGKEPIRYNVFTNPISTINHAFYFDRSCREGRFFLLVENGLGGMDSVMFRGDWSAGGKTEKQMLRKTRWEDSSPRRKGDLVTYHVDAQDTYTVHTGYYPKAYIMHLRQALAGNAWIIDTKHTRLEKVDVTTSDFEVEQRGDLFALSLELETAYFKENFAWV